MHRAYCLVVEDVRSGKPVVNHWYGNAARRLKDDWTLDWIRELRPKTHADLTYALKRIGVSPLKEPYSWETLMLWIDEVLVFHIEGGRLQGVERLQDADGPWPWSDGA